jgi:hypothetical protein
MSEACVIDAPEEDKAGGGGEIGGMGGMGGFQTLEAKVLFFSCSYLPTHIHVLNTYILSSLNLSFIFTYTHN